jgi:hypothetical protein
VKLGSTWKNRGERHISKNAHKSPMREKVSDLGMHHPHVRHGVMRPSHGSAYFLAFLSQMLPQWLRRHSGMRSS